MADGMFPLLAASSFAGPVSAALTKAFLPFVALGVGVLMIMSAFSVMRAATHGSSRRRGNAYWCVKPKALLTSPERKMLELLEAALPECRIHAQVSMGALLVPVRGLSRGSHSRVRNRFSQKIVDFVAEHRASGEVIALIELDDSTHSPARDRIRDEMTGEAGYRTVRFHRDRWPTQSDVRLLVLPQVNERYVQHVG